MNISVNSALFEALKDYRVGCLLAECPSAGQVGEIFEKSAKASPAQTDAKQWKQALPLGGAKPKKQKTPYEVALQAAEDSVPPELPADALAAAASLASGACVAAYRAPATGELFFGYNEDELSMPVAGGESEQIRPVELVLHDGKEILCRRWNVRRGDLAAPESGPCVFWVEAFDEDKAQKALRFLSDFFGDTASKTVLLSAENNQGDTVTGETGKTDFSQEIPRQGPPKNIKKQKKGNAEPGQHWADQMAAEIEERVFSDPKLKAIYDRQGILVYDEKTPSGIIHVGSGRGWVIHDVVAKALRSRGLKAEFVLSSDDYDPYDKPNKDLKQEEWNRYLGMPFSEMPSPVEGHASFGDYYFHQATSRFDRLGIECGLESTADNYKKGIFNDAIRTLLDKHQEVQEVYRKLYGDESEGTKKLPVNMRCEKCGKIATTMSSKWDSKKALVFYSCKSGIVEWADGCGHEGWGTPFDGGCKMPWKVEWAAKWPSRGVIVEFAGKDHFSKGGSRTCSNHISVDVLDFPPPYPSRGYATGQGYEFFQVGGAKMSTSKGRGLSFSEAVDFFPGPLLRFLLLRPKPNVVVDFDPEKNDIILLCDQYDRAERIRFGAESADETEKRLQGRVYELVGSPCQKLPPQIPLPLAATSLQAALSVDGAIELLKEMGHLPEDLDDHDRRAVLERLELAQRWVSQYASDQFLFQLVDEEVGAEGLETDEKTLISAFADWLEADAPAEAKELHNAIYEFARTGGTEPKDLFRSVYRALIGKDKGPQLAGFLLTVGVKRAARILRAGAKS